MICTAQGKYHTTTGKQTEELQDIDKKETELQDIHSVKDKIQSELANLRAQQDDLEKKSKIMEQMSKQSHKSYSPSPDA